MRNSSRLSAATASSTVAKLSSTYWVQMLRPITGRSSFGRVYDDSVRNNRLATSPRSFMPSQVPMSYPAVTTLP